MRQALDKTLRTQLESTVLAAREVVETACREEIERLGVADATVPAFLNDGQRKLRNRLRAHARQLGDPLHDNGKQETAHLLAEMAYEQWHRMLFARFLEQNNLLMYDAYTPVTLDECAELLEEETDCASAWELAGRLAAKMLPQVFRVDSPVLAVRLPINHQRTLEGLIMALSPAVFEAQDSLGWCYQFWQTKRKKEVNDSGVPIGADELSPVTQLFTEPYMVSFLLDNALGAWWAKRRLTDDHLRHASDEQELRERAAIDGVPLTYLRFVKVTDTQGECWQPAGGWYDAWPQNISELKTLDPCCGSGHFLVALFLMLVPMRMHLEGCDANTAIERVIAQNLHGLELDGRCIEIAAFALALEAWRFPNAGGYRPLPALQLACSGQDVLAASNEWQQLAKQNPELEPALAWLMSQFSDAPVLGSLIDIKRAHYEGKAQGAPAPWQQLLDAHAQSDDESKDASVAAQGLALAAKLLAGSYHLVATNVPYRGRGDLCQELKDFCDNYYPEAKADLATVFLERCLDFNPQGGSSTIVLPQNWLFLTSYKKFREKLLTEQTWNLLARLGEKGFESAAAAGAFVALITLSKGVALKEAFLRGLDVSNLKTTEEKHSLLQFLEVESSLQSGQLKNPDSRISMGVKSALPLLSSYAECLVGMQSGDDPRYVAFYWELKERKPETWEWLQNTPFYFDSDVQGMVNVVRWERGNGCLLNSQSARPTQGLKAVGKPGIAVHRMRKLFAYRFSMCRFHQNLAVIIPNEDENIDAIYAFCSSSDFEDQIRKIDQKLNVTNATLIKVPFDLNYWKKIAKEEYPSKNWKPYTNDPTQWIFHGHPCASVVWDEESKWTKEGTVRFDETVLQVAVARLLGYQWPAELDEEMELADEQRQLVDEVAKLNAFADEDGIVCLPAVRGEAPAHTRLEKMLVAAYEDDWKNGALDKLLTAVGSKSLELWLRDKFFEQHCKLFQHRPFIWHIWDGLKDGFSALVNYHKLDRAGLERLIYTYLGDWIRIQEQGVKEQRDGAEERLTAAKNLQQRLEAILAGEKGLDIFVRWKPLAEQPIGWEPDLNDGVRLNIRPFLKVADVGKKGAGILRFKPNINWNKDRGNDVASAPWYTIGLQYGEKEGARINDHHLSLAEKKHAREQQA
ncbi:Eco57I restriction-modification methylase domain-containing protein [Aeromonas rivipollensis]|uniref:Eco57I restriction-modification methylase domain-containing protein n=1 Tax=Aeromonas rivipollensis TaxID=948519 RepID=UPI00259D98F2|nr:DNA methyltransferase [Aeromonas rivipollensis]MDM5125029.1 BREX-1 system adenine-specific DNA-methyltransferase PglX [Aeromonas rivipollensis]